MLESVLLAPQKQDEYIKQLASKVDLLTIHNKMLEIQIAQQASSSTIPLVDYQVSLNKTLGNNAMPLCWEETRVLVMRWEVKRDRIRVQPHCLRSKPEEKRENEKEKESKTLPPKPYMPALSFPQRFAKTKLDG